MLKLQIEERRKRTSEGVKTFWVGEYVSGPRDDEFEVDYVLAPWAKTGIALKKHSLYGCEVVKTKKSIYYGKSFLVAFFIPIGEVIEGGEKDMLVIFKNGERIMKDEETGMEIVYGSGNMDFHDRRVGKILSPPQEGENYFLPLEKTEDGKIIKEAKIHIDKSFISVNEEGMGFIEFPLKGRLEINGNKIIPDDNFRVTYYVCPPEKYLSFSSKDMLISGQGFCLGAMEILMPDPVVPSCSNCKLKVPNPDELTGPYSAYYSEYSHDYAHDGRNSYTAVAEHLLWRLCPSCVGDLSAGKIPYFSKNSISGEDAKMIYFREISEKEFLSSASFRKYWLRKNYEYRLLQNK